MTTEDIKIICFTSKIPELRRCYEQIKNTSEDLFKEKRNFELSIAKSVTNCDYKRLKSLISMAFSEVDTSDFKNLTLVYHTVGIITLLTRLAIIDGVSEKYAYSLSDAYLSLDFQNLDIELLELIYEITENFVKLIENVKFFKYDSLLIIQITNYIHNNIGQKLTIKDLATIFQVTPEHLSSHFKLVTGLTVKGFINREKINHAKFFLVSTDLSLLEIALELGYPDQSYFSKVFKKYTKTSPLQFRINGRIKLGISG